MPSIREAASVAIIVSTGPDRAAGCDIGLLSEVIPERSVNNMVFHSEEAG